MSPTSPTSPDPWRLVRRLLVFGLLVVGVGTWFRSWCPDVTTPTWTPSKRSVPSSFPLLVTRVQPGSLSGDARTVAPEVIGFVQWQEQRDAAPGATPPARQFALWPPDGSVKESVDHLQNELTKARSRDRPDQSGLRSVSYRKPAAGESEAVELFIDDGAKCVRAVYAISDGDVRPLEYAFESEKGATFRVAIRNMAVSAACLFCIIAVRSCLQGNQKSGITGEQDL